MFFFCLFVAVFVLRLRFVNQCVRNFDFVSNRISKRHARKLFSKKKFFFFLFIGMKMKLVSPNETSEFLIFFFFKINEKMPLAMKHTVFVKLLTNCIFRVLFFFCVNFSVLFSNESIDFGLCFRYFEYTQFK